MASNFFLSDETANAECDAATAKVNSGYIKCYDGTPPADANTALSGNTLLGTLTFGATAFAAASGGIANANAITGGTAVAGGTPTFFRTLKSNGTSVGWQGTIGNTGCDMNFASPPAFPWAIGDPINLTSMIYKVPEH